MENKIDNICRLCLENGQLQSIFIENEKMPFSDMIRACLFIQVSKGDGLPEAICETCVSQLYSFYNFKKKCEISDEKLRDHLDTLKKSTLIENIKVELLNNYLNEENTKGLPLKRSSIQVKYICDYCNKRFKTENSLKKHCMSHIQINESAEMFLPDINCYPNSKTNESIKVILQNENDVVSHVDDIQIVNRKSEEQNKIEKNKFLFQCEQCGRIFKQKSVLSQHLQSHSGVKPFMCNICDSKFTRSAHLAAHYRIHMKIRPFICETCGKGFTKSSDLCRHKRIHSDEKNYPCNMCEKKFKRSADVISHMRSHTGQKPYICRMCSKSYSSHSALTKHTKSISHGIKLKITNIKEECNSNNVK